LKQHTRDEHKEEFSLQFMGEHHQPVGDLPGYGTVWFYKIYSNLLLNFAIIKVRIQLKFPKIS